MEVNVSKILGITSGESHEAMAIEREDGSLLSQLGPQHLPYNSLVPMTVVYIIIFITGMVGNCATCIVIAKNQYMQSATNYYLFNLAVADMLTLAFGESLSSFSIKSAEFLHLRMNIQLVWWLIGTVLLVR